MKAQKQPKHRVVVVLTAEEKEGLQILAWDSQRSMSSYLRFLLRNDIMGPRDRDNPALERFLEKLGY